MIDIFPMTKESLASVEIAEQEIFSDPWSKKSLESQITSSFDKSFVAFEDGAFCGYLIANVIEGEGEILRIATIPTHRKQGIGKKMLSGFLEQQENTYLEVRKSNHPARSLYESLGFSVIGTRKNYYKDPADDAVLYHYQSKGQNV